MNKCNIDLNIIWGLTIDIFLRLRKSWAFQIILTYTFMDLSLTSLNAGLV